MSPILQPWCQYSAQLPVDAMWTVVPDIYNVFTAPHIKASIFKGKYQRCYSRYIDNSICVILQTWCQIQRTSASLRCLDCSPGHIQCDYSSTYSVFNIQLNVSELLLEIYRQFNVRYTANMVPNAAHILHFTQCALWSCTYTMKVQVRIFRVQYSAEHISAAIGDISTIQWVLYCKHGAKYSAHPPLYAMWTVVPDIFSVNTVPQILAPTFKWTYLRCYLRYVANSMSPILQTLCQIQCTTSSLSYLNCDPGHIQSKYSSGYSGFNIQLRVSALILEMCRQFNAPYTAKIVKNTAHFHQITQCELWSRPYTL
jgi:hypothetical protein